MDTGKIIANQALKIYIGIVGYFLLMKLLHLEHLVQLRAFNFFIVLWGVNTAVKKNIFDNLDNGYLKNLSVAFSTAFMAVVGIAISLAIYLSFINSDLIMILENSMMWGSHLSTGKILFAILIEGMASSVICSFLIMQYWKKHKIESLFH